jgi:tripartite-type tricarboxylate transporter receptor subunit TctC
MTDLLAGQVQIVFTTPGSAMSYVKARTLRALAVTSAVRMDVLPDCGNLARLRCQFMGRHRRARTHAG